MAYDVRNINAELEACDLSFREQCKIVYEGFKRGAKFDGCTGVPDFNFAICCAEHDVYFQGKSIEDVDFHAANKKLFDCMLKKGLPFKFLGVTLNTNLPVALTFFLGVSTFGRFFYKGKQREKTAKLSIPDVDRDLSGPN